MKERLQITTIWTGDVNTATTKNYTKTPRGSALLWIVLCGTDTNCTVAHLCSQGTALKPSIMSIETTYKNTVYARNISLGTSSFTTGAGYYWRNNTTTAGDYLHIYQIHTLGWYA